MENPDLQGLFAVIPTPFTGDGEVDERGVEHLVRHAAESGLHAAVVLGSNGEFPYLTSEEKARVIRAAGRAGRGRIPVVAGASARSTREAVELARLARESGCAAVLAALEVYFRVGFAEVREHFAALGREGGLPVIFYYFPEVTGLELAMDEIAELSRVPGLHGAKITVFNKRFLKKAVERTRTRLWAVFAGTGFMIYEALKAGGAGAICPIPLLAPADCLAVYRAMEKGALAEARKAQERIRRAVPLFAGADIPPAMGPAFYKAMINAPYTGPAEGIGSGVALVKEVLRLQGHPIDSSVRRPQRPLAAEDKEWIRAAAAELGWI
jgi:4-hydroxy-tetrahydrodipicolinate synthase